MPSARTHRLPLLAVALTALALALLTLLLPAPVDARRQSSSCASASTDPHAARYVIVRGATLCLINAERRKHGLRPLRHNRRLARAAGRHATDMVRHRYFSHDSRDRRGFVARIRRTGYLRGASRWVLGENLAWGGGSLATPRAIVRAWMKSPGHRRNILSRRFDEIGIAFVLDAPFRGTGPAATFVTEFGRR